MSVITVWVTDVISDNQDTQWEPLFEHVLIPDLNHMEMIVK